MAEIAHLGIIQGDHKIFEVSVTDLDGNPADITSYDAVFSIKKITDSSTPMLQKTLSDGVALSDPTNGKIQITLTSSDTSLSPGKYHYDVQIKDTAGRVSTVVMGNLYITADVTDN